MLIRVILILLIMCGTVVANPDHLTPIAAYDVRGYNQAVFKSLIGNVRAELWMIVRPNFSTEYAIIYYQDREYERKNGRISTPLKIVKDEWFLERVEAKQKIWKWKELSNGTDTLDIHSTDEVTRKKILVRQDQFKIISKAWKAILYQTKYPDYSRRGIDGTTYQFYAHHKKFGQTWQPKKGLPLSIVNLGLLLEKLVTSEPEDREQIFSKANELAIEILKKIP